MKNIYMNSECAKAYIQPKARVVEMSCEGLLCVSSVFLLNSYDQGEDIDFDFHKTEQI